MNDDSTASAKGQLLFLAPEQSTFTSMLESWQRRLTSRGLRPVSISRNIAAVERFQRYVDTWPWQWRPGDIEDFTSALLSGPSPLSRSTIRSYHLSLRGFCSFLTDERSGWASICEERFDSFPSQIVFDDNSQLHAHDFEANPKRRPFTYEELQVFFDALDSEVERIARDKKKGALAALRDAQFFKTAYAFGLRRNECRMLDLTDLHPNASRPDLGHFGLVHVRYGKAVASGSPRRRSVLAVPEMDWAIAGLTQWVEQGRPLFSDVRGEVLWPTERRTRVSTRYIDRKFAAIRTDLGLDPALTLHSLRHSYVTHLIEYGYPERFVQEQVGHSYASSTAICTSVSNDFKNRVVAQALTRVYPKELQ